MMTSLVCDVISDGVRPGVCVSFFSTTLCHFGLFGPLCKTEDFSLAINQYVTLVFIKKESWGWGESVVKST